MTTISDEETTRNSLAGLVPKCTVNVPKKLLPRIVTFVPPFVGPTVGVTRVTVGAATKAYLPAAVVLLEPPVADTVT
jgi:hypothetical protein